MVNEVIHQLYDQLSPANQDVVAMLIRNIAEKEGIEAVESSSLLTPRDGVELWASDLELQGLSRTTARSYKQKVEVLLNQYEKPNEVDIRTFLTELMKTSEKAKGTAANYIKAFRSFFRYLYDNKLWNTNPALRLKLPRIRYVPRRSPTEDEVRKLIAVISNPLDYFIVAALANTGLRVSELVERQLIDVDIDQKRLNVIGKGGKQRWVPINEGFFPLFKEYYDKVYAQGETWLFPAQRRDSEQGYMNRNSVTHMLARYCKKAGIESISPHQLRHFLATYILTRGGDVKAVSELLGHANVNITLMIYHHIGERNVRDMVNRLAPASQERVALPEATTINGEYKEIDET